jgi:hypothetical protein
MYAAWQYDTFVHYAVGSFKFNRDSRPPEVRSAGEEPRITRIARIRGDWIRAIRLIRGWRAAGFVGVGSGVVDAAHALMCSTRIAPVDACLTCEIPGQAEVDEPEQPTTVNEGVEVEKP